MKGLWRWGLGLAALALAGASILSYRAWREDVAEVGRLALATGYGQRNPEAASQLGEDRYPYRGRMRLARRVLAEQLDPRWLLELPEADRQDAFEASLIDIEGVEELAAKALSQRPASWEAAMMLGSARHFRALRSSSRDPADLPDWQAPFGHSIRLSPVQVEPAGYLAAAYVDMWPSLDAAERRAAREVIAKAFTSRTTFRLLIDRWMRVEHDIEEALRVVPAATPQWEHMMTVFAGQKDWSRYLRAHQAHRLASATEKQAMLDEAVARVRGGDYSGGVERLHVVLSWSTVGADDLGILDRVLRELPAGPVSHPGKFRDWLEYCLDQCFLRECPLDQERLRRLIGLSGELEESQRALALLASGDLPAAERIERAAVSPSGVAWGRYWIAKAGELAARGHAGEARQALAWVDPRYLRHPAYLRAALAVAQAEGDAAAENDALRRLASLERTAWPPEVWEAAEQPLHSALIYSAGSLRGVEIAIDSAPTEGAIVRIRVDGRDLLVTVVRPGDVVRVEPETGPGTHRIELQTVRNGRVTPGRVRIHS